MSQAGSQALSQAETQGTAFAQQQVDYATSAAYQALPPDVQNAIQFGNNTLQQTQPAVNLIGNLINGNAVNAQQVVAALAAVVTVVNPIAGGAVLVAGEIGIEFADLFSKLFGTDNTPDPTWDYVGYLRVNIDPIPYAPSIGQADDPRWMYLAANPTPSCDLTDLDNLLGTTFGGCPYVPPTIPAPYAPTRSSWNRNYFFSQAIALCFDPIEIAKRTAFEVFLATLLVKNLEYWANGNPFVPAQTLLQGAIGAWNSAHPSGTPYTVQPPTLVQAVSSGGGWTTATSELGSPVQGTIQGADPLLPIVSMLLSPIATFLDAPGAQAVTADSRPVAIWGINGDGGVAAVGAASTAAATTATNVVASAAALPVGAALGTIAYSLVAGRPALSGLQALWAFARSRIPL